MNLIAGTFALSPNNQTQFLASNGTPPYVYSVLPGGAGGTIDSSSGAYVAPEITGEDVVIATDSLGDEISEVMTVGNSMQLFCDVIRREMELSRGRVLLWDQKFPIPTDYDLYIAVSNLTCKPFGSSNKMNSFGESVQSVNMHATLSVDIYSRGPAARDRKEEIILALMSDYSESQQEINSFYIAPLSGIFVNLSQVDGAAIPYRFNISVAIQYFVTNTKAVRYYENFQNSEVTTGP